MFALSANAVCATPIATAAANSRRSSNKAAPTARAHQNGPCIAFFSGAKTQLQMGMGRRAARTENSRASLRCRAAAKDDKEAWAHNLPCRGSPARLLRLVLLVLEPRLTIELTGSLDLSSPARFSWSFISTPAADTS